MRRILFIFACNLIKEIYSLFRKVERFNEGLNHFGYHNSYKTYVLNIIKAKIC